MLSDATQVLAELEALGKEQTRKIYKRHGVGDNQYGVSFADLKKLHKKIKLNHDIAVGLWASGNHDARVLATMIADPRKADNALLETWAHDLDNYSIADAFSNYVAETRFARDKMADWVQADHEWIETAGWNLLSHLALRDDSLTDAFFEPYLDIIERDLHSGKNRVRYAMNNALISIGMRDDELEAKAFEVARKIGKVIVDHGETNCKTPDAIPYIEKSKSRKLATS
jgi:3-methyladenine DNA glycosylase AlkD